MNKSEAVRTYAFLAYWLAWCLFTVRQGQYPGFEDLSRWHYPVWGVAIVSTLIGVLIGILYLILRPATYRRSWGRLCIAVVYSAVLVFAGMSTIVTDMPGHAYVPAMFAVVNMAVVLVFAAIQGGMAIFKVGQHAA